MMMWPKNNFVGGFIVLDKYLEIAAQYPELADQFRLLGDVPGSAVTFELATTKDELVGPSSQAIYLQGKSIMTSYPNLVRSWLGDPVEKGISIDSEERWYRTTSNH